VRGVAALSAKRERRSAVGTHRYCSAVRLPRLEGMVPLSVLRQNSLHAGVVAVSAKRDRRCAAGTHRSSSAVKLPMLDGMVPLSWLL
jgi:hypothetical protein